MAKLSRLPGALALVRPRVAYLERDRDQDRAAAAPWRAWYKTARWQRLRWSVLVAADFTCARCQRMEADTALLVADHVTPHRGDAALFWDRRNLQCLCKPCHDRDKQREERAGWSGAAGGGGGQSLGRGDA